MKSIKTWANRSKELITQHFKEIIIIIVVVLVMLMGLNYIVEHLHFKNENEFITLVISYFGLFATFGALI
ncbi:hypothetical protein [Staphylococcus petrasii]|uniref:hypothetical protein n=1 Tax=Staphylococcus petrasii TaxID=1276936 RepID=UPI001F5AD660|nr:hypothetical protein [Staphylococcus petrasii]MCI2773603.1 hypothetical protein [Staphylococcus petrasii]